MRTMLPHHLRTASAVIRTVAAMLTRACGIGLLLLAAACDPCFGTFSCTDERISAEGRLIWHLSGDDAAGVEVRFFRTGGAALAGGDTLYALSREDGTFHIEGRAAGAGPVEGTLLFRPPSPYEAFLFAVPGVSVSAVRTRGDVRFLGIWGVGPLRGARHLSYVGEVRDAADGGALAGVEVEFRRTGGIMVQPDTFRVVSAGDGRFPLLMVPAADGEVIGELWIRPPPPWQVKHVPELRLQTLTGVDDIRLAGVWRVER
jgi:hypothetical protein